jgi:membrane associated rhomboid family serine protease
MFGKAFLKDPIFPHCIIPIIVSVLLVAVFCLPDNLKEQYVLRGDLEYAHSHCITLISSHYIHMDISHLAGNLAAFLFIYIPAVLYLRFLDLQTKAEKDKLVKRTYIVHLVNLLLLPPIISECVLRYPSSAYSYGFSGIVNAYLGYLYALFLATRPVFLNLKAGTRYILLLSVLGISLCPTPWVGGSSVLLICAVLLLLDVRKTGKQREVLKELLITIVVVLVVYFLIEMGIPLRIIYKNINIGIGAHYLGLLFGSLINAFIIVEGKIWLLALLLLLVLALVLVSPLPAV